jgi:hypothetical protein
MTCLSRHAIDYGTQLLTIDSYAYRWIAEKVTEILKSEDDVVIELIYNLIEGPRYVRRLTYCTLQRI